MERPRVLVADDDADIRELLRDALTEWGYEVTPVGSGQDAVGLFTRQLFDAALLDIWMPRMDGIQLLDKRFRTRDVRTLRTRLGEALAVKELVGTSPQMARVKELVERVAESDSPVLIEGESGTGKEGGASAVHRRSTRAQGPHV